MSAPDYGPEITTCRACAYGTAETATRDALRAPAGAYSVGGRHAPCAVLRVWSVVEQLGTQRRPALLTLQFKVSKSEGKSSGGILAM